MPKAALDQLGTDIDAYLAPLNGLLADPVTNRAALIAGIDGFLDGAVALLDRCARFNLNLSGWGFAFAWRAAAFTDLLAQASGLVASQAAFSSSDQTRPGSHFFGGFHSLPGLIRLKE